MSNPFSGHIYNPNYIFGGRPKNPNEQVDPYTGQSYDLLNHPNAGPSLADFFRTGSAGGLGGTPGGTPTGGQPPGTPSNPVGPQNPYEQQSWADIWSSMPRGSEEAQARLAWITQAESAPLRQGIYSSAWEALQGNNVLNTPEYAAAKAQYDSQFNRAKDNTIARFAPGGALMDAMSDLETQRALGLSGAAGDIWGRTLDRAMNVAAGQGAIGSSALSGAAAIEAANKQAGAARDAATMNALGSAAGYYLGNSKKFA